MPSRVERTLAWVVPIAGGLLFFALWLAYRDFWLDDAFITFRYAKNWADGLGPVFNPGEAVEGYTTFSWTLLVAVAFALLSGGAALMLVKFSGLCLGLFVLWRSYTFPGPDPHPGANGALRRRPLMLLLAANPVFVANCGDGMETPLFMALLMECARASLVPPSRRSGALAGVLAAACIWTRPEALPLLLGLPAVLLFFHRGAAFVWVRAFALTALPPVLGHIAWRLWYYGAPLPNTFYAKATGDILARLAKGVVDVAEFASLDHGVPAVGLWVALALALLGLRGRRGAWKWLTLLWGGIGFRLAFDVWSGSEYMGTFRFLAPALPLLFVLADEGARDLMGTAARRAVPVAVAIGTAFSVWGHVALSDARDRYTTGLERAHLALGAWLFETQPEGTWVALGDAGAIPFASGLPVIDLWGLADATIARLPGEYGDRPGTADYALGRRPGVIVIWNVVPIQKEPGRLRILGAWPFDREIAEHLVFAREYRFVREFTFRPETIPGSGYYLDVFLHRPGAANR